MDGFCDFVSCYCNYTKMSSMLTAILNFLPTSASSMVPEVDLKVPEIIKKWNYPVEVHQTVTEDGFILELHRIPHGIKGSTKKQRPVIFLQHGLLSSSSDWVMDLPSQSAAFVFADAGFDVWLGNMRGNTYTLNHTTLSSQDAKFWDWTWDKMSQYDTPALINYTLQNTGQPNLYYVGHSQGAVTMFGHLSENPSFAEKIKTFYALSPATSFKHSNGLATLLLRLFAGQTNLPKIHMPVLPSNSIVSHVLSLLRGNNLLDELSSQLLFAFAGREEGNWNSSRVPVYFSHFPDGTSNLNLIHWGQMLSVVGVQKFDYGFSSVNHQHYGQNTPPFYDFTAIKCPTMIFYGGNDVLVNKQDVETWLIPKLSGTLKEIVYLPTFNHLDFIWGLNGAPSVYNKIIDDISNDS